MNIYLENLHFPYFDIDHLLLSKPLSPDFVPTFFLLLFRRAPESLLITRCYKKNLGVFNDTWKHEKSISCTDKTTRFLFYVDYVSHCYVCRVLLVMTRDTMFLICSELSHQMLIIWQVRSYKKGNLGNFCCGSISTIFNILYCVHTVEAEPWLIVLSCKYQNLGFGSHILLVLRPNKKMCVLGNRSENFR